MLKLGVNIDHVATLREARYRGAAWGEPEPVAAALDCETAGAHGITAHLREDRRHILDRDIWALRKTIRTRLNLEMANAPEIIEIALKVRPEIVCVVPERRQEITTEGGLDVAGNLRAITQTRERMNAAGIEVSLFISPTPSKWKPRLRPAPSLSSCTRGRSPTRSGTNEARKPSCRGSYRRQSRGVS
jgi:pyridoxine 5-phosphate synthase